MMRPARAKVASDGTIEGLDQPAPITSEEIAQLLRDAQRPSLGPAQARVNLPASI